VDYYFSAEADLNRGGDVNYLPVSGPHQAFSVRVPPKHDSVLIGELLARNSNGLKDKAGDRDDWIELLNLTSQPVRLDGRFLTDNSAEPRKWTFPAGTTLAAGGRMIVWADEEPKEGKLHASFKLSGDGEELALVDTDGITLLDRVAFGPQAKDVSLGRLFDRVSPFVTFPTPTPNAPNELSPCGVRELGPPVPGDATMHLSATGSFKPGTDMTLQLASAPKNSAWLLQVGTQPDVVRLPPGIDVYSMVKLPPVLEVVLPTDATGQSVLKARIPDQPKLVGVKLSFWAVSHDGQRFTAANSLELGICRK
jgi:hypothetical protein